MSTALARPQFDEASARGLTDEVKADAAALWSKLVDLYEGCAHTALGYSSWGSYCSSEFDIGESRAYQLIDAGRVRSTIVERGQLPAPRTEAVARELAPLRDQPEEMHEVWVRATDLHGPEPTAAQVRQLVRTPAPDHDDVRRAAAIDIGPVPPRAVFDPSQREWDDALRLANDAAKQVRSLPDFPTSSGELFRAAALDVAKWLADAAVRITEQAGQSQAPSIRRIK